MKKTRREFIKTAGKVLGLTAIAGMFGELLEPKPRSFRFMKPTYSSNTILAGDYIRIGEDIDCSNALRVHIDECFIEEVDKKGYPQIRKGANNFMKGFPA